MRSQSDPIENSSRHGAIWHVRKLIKISAQTHMSEGKSKNRDYFAGRHGKQRKSTDKCSRFSFSPEIAFFQSLGVRVRDFGARKALHQHPGKGGVSFNQ